MYKVTLTGSSSNWKIPAECSQLYGLSYDLCCRIRNGGLQCSQSLEDMIVSACLISDNILETAQDRDTDRMEERQEAL